MPFGDPVVAGSTLVRDAIQSEDYRPGVAGWIIRRDGSAEFNVGTYRGSVVINGPDGLPAVTINADGILTKDNSSGSSVQITHTQEDGATLRLAGADPLGLAPAYMVNDGYLVAGLGNVQQADGQHIPYLTIEAPYVSKVDGSDIGSIHSTQIVMDGADLDGSGSGIYLNARVVDVSNEFTIGGAKTTFGPWTEYVPSTPGGALVLGSGSLIGRYRENGKTVEFTFTLIWGSTTSWPGTAWLVNVPLGQAYNKNASGSPFPQRAFACTIFDSSAGNAGRFGCTAQFDNAFRLIFLAPAGGVLTPTVPFAWGAGDSLTCTGTYERA